MLGEQICESRGKRIVRRVLAVDPISIEVSFEDGGKLLGVDYSGFGTYSAELRQDGTLYGEGRGGAATTDGEMVTWQGSAVGRIKEGGGISYRGMLYYRTTSKKLARLNGVAGAFEFEADAKGDLQSKVWEWR